MLKFGKQIVRSRFVILIVAHFLAKFKDNRYVNGAFYGLRPASIAMITAAGLNVVKIAISTNRMS